MRNSLHVVSAECGYNRTHRACMHDAATLRSVCASGSFQLHQHALSMERQHPQAMMIPSWNGRQWESLPLLGTSGTPSTLIIFRPPSPVSDCDSRMQSMIEASTFPNGSGPPPLPAPFAEPPILPQAPPSAAGVSTSHLPAIMDGSVGPATDGSTSAAAHKVDGVTTKPPENAPLTAGQLRERPVVPRGKARVSFSFTTLPNGAVTTAPKHACKMPHCYPDHVSPKGNSSKEASS